MSRSVPRNIHSHRCEVLWYTLRGMSETIRLTRGVSAIVDDADYAELARHKWYAQKSARGTFYAARSVSIGGGRSRTAYMHRVILGCEAEVDHVNGLTLDNRRSNLRPSDRTQQNRNRHRKMRGCSSDHIGVYLKPSGRWCAQITVNYKTKSLGLFDTQEEASAARLSATRDLYGDDRVQVST